MNFYTKQHKFYCGIDLHTTKMYLCILDKDGVIRLHRNIQTKPDLFLKAIEPFREDVVVCVECMFSWYWLADLCARQKIPFVLGHALYMGAIHGGKSKNDKIDSRKIAGLLRGGMLPMAFVYPEKMRAARDLLRRRNHLMRKRAELLAHIQNTAKQYNLPDNLGCISKARQRTNLLELFHDPVVRTSIKANLDIINAHDSVLAELEREIIKNAKHHDPTSYALLLTIPGVGKIIALDLPTKSATFHDFQRYRNLPPIAVWLNASRNPTAKNTDHQAKRLAMLIYAGPLDKQPSCSTCATKEKKNS